MEAKYIRPLIISTKDTTAWFATKPWYPHLIYASVSASSRDARIHSTRHLGLLRLQQAKKPYVMYASVSARSRDARILHKSVLHRGSARPSQALMQIMYASVSAQSRDARMYYTRHLGLLQAQQAKISYVMYASVSAQSTDSYSFCMYCLALRLGAT